MQAVGMGLSLDHERLSVDAVPALLSFFDAGHVCRFANRYHCEWYGRTPEELVGLHMRDFVGADAYASRRPYLDRVSTGEMVAFESTVPHLDGSWRDAAIRYVPHFGEQGFDGFFILVVDIERQTHRYHRVFDATAVAFWEIDISRVQQRLAEEGGDAIAFLKANPGFIRDTLQETAVLDLNRRAETMFGLHREAAMRVPFGTWCPPSSEPVFRDNLIAFLSGKPGFEAETVLTRADGSEFAVHLSLAFPEKLVDASAATIAVMDISERVAREQALARANADLAHAARVATLGELTASIAHEVNQPLAAVVANGNAALRWLRRGTPDLGEATAAIQRMVDEATRASQIIARTRKMAMKDAGDRTPICCNEVIGEAIAIVGRQLSGLGAELSLDLAEAPPKLIADRVQLQQVVINIVVNAAQAMSEYDGPERRIEIRSRAIEDRMVVEIADTGPGISEERAAQLFSAFYTTKATGMGIGLSVSKTIIEAHGGTIAALPRDGAGACFRFELPIQAI
jgi:PAS domain S-box-containing protein